MGVHKRILLITDSLGAGGAQRQLILLAKGLGTLGHEVNILTYRPNTSTPSAIDELDIRHYELSASTIAGTFLKIRRFLSKNHFDSIIAFQNNATAYIELAGIGLGSKIIVSERNNLPRKRGFNQIRFWRLMHVLADSVTTNSYSNCEAIEEDNPMLRGKVLVIYNAVEKYLFHRFRTPRQHCGTRFVIFASHKPQKNFCGLAGAVSLVLQQNQGVALSVDWYGDDTPRHDRALNEAFVVEHGLENVVRIHPAISHAQVINEMLNADAVILPSLWEGLPNVICEAMAVGCPVLMSDVCDARRLINDGVSGFLFEPSSSVSIAAGIVRFMSLSEDARFEMGAKAREAALDLFDMSTFVHSYAALI